MHVALDERKGRSACSVRKSSVPQNLHFYRYVVFNTQPYILAQHSQLVIASGV
jgi:hypothetical protein